MTRRPPPLLVAAGLVALGLALLLVTGWLIGGEPLALDRAILTGMRAWGGPPWLREAARDLTALGSGTVLTLVVLAAVALLLAGGTG